ncbi:non-heme ferritin [Klebsiella pneumoniae]|uniref:non-heme ferritin n=1 Tax=Klebsiella pneumoniae TaxID=573 RepID=UPI003F68082A
MLKTDMIDKLNEQMNLELYSSLLYQQMSAWCSYHSFEGAAAFLRRHAQEEMTHMQRLFDYLTDTGSLPRINAIASPFAEYASLDELFRQTYEHEQLITQKINELAHAAMTSQDYPTFNFLQWYVAEQHEEEKLFKSVIDKLTLAGKSGEGLYFIDKELATRAATVRVAALLMSADLIFCDSKTFLSGNKFAFFL